MTVEIKVYEEGTQNLVKEYTGEVENHKEMHNFFQEARRVWDEYVVVASTHGYEMSYSCTYKEQISKG